MWLDAYDYVWEGGARWLLREASRELPFAAVIARPLAAMETMYNEVNEMTGLRLDFAGEPLTLKTWEGEVTT